MVCIGKEIQDKQEEAAVGAAPPRSQSQSRSLSQSPSPSRMELSPGRSKPLHNFLLPGVNWGTQKYLRCMKLNDSNLNLNPNSYSKSPSPASFCDSDSQNPKLSPNSPNLANGKVLLGEKRLDTKVSRSAEKEESGLAVAAAAAAAEEEETRPWNLRTRRGACKAAAATTTGGERTENVFGATIGGKVRGGERAKFSLSLSRKEVEEDFMIVAGHKPARRPKRRPRAVQKQLDVGFVLFNWI